ncbi:hypothetical protein [Lachnoclostridium phytofermentans]|uniref:Uncharacterized protein n=1 Tax=Lachnoclostridium phytofermentans (strain ATCC 700394 / DSM 18823 / ISDg) TaxID=357809 RepID=A9KM60_LACP7|nr:hypothetical protein [Lachnoclostridium phytofermentans]ABX41403.1 hypothetical protein Cphy_1023 [Lachnoclostridium phytofermentans ISDg]
MKYIGIIKRLLGINMFNKRRIKKDYRKIEKCFSKHQNYCEKQKNMKDQLEKNYNETEKKDYSEKELLKRLQYLQNGLGLYQSFYISVITGAIFLTLSLCLPGMMQITLDYESKIAQHKYLLNNDEFYAEGYKQGIIDMKQDSGSEYITSSIDFDVLHERQVNLYFDGYNYAQNDGYGYSSFNLIILIIIAYLGFTIYIYCQLKSQQNAFNKYQTNDFEIDLIKKKLGIVKNETKHYRVKLKNQGRKVKVSVDEIEIVEEL